MTSEAANQQRRRFLVTISYLITPGKVYAAFRVRRLTLYKVVFPYRPQQ